MSKLSRNILYNVAGQVLLAGLGFVAVKYIFERRVGDAGQCLFKGGLFAGR